MSKLVSKSLLIMGGRRKRPEWWEEEVLRLPVIAHYVFLQHAYSHVSRFYKWRIAYPYPYRVSCNLGFNLLVI